jgi:hypothetical protein
MSTQAAQFKETGAVNFCGKINLVETERGTSLHLSHNWLVCLQSQRSKRKNDAAAYLRS